MKALMLCLLFLFSPVMEDAKEYIVIKHNGENDKFFQTLVISTEEIEILEKKREGQPIEFVGISESHFLLSDKVYSVFKDSIISIGKNHHVEKCFEYGTFDVTCNKGDENVFFYKLNREGSKLLFPKLIKIVEDANGDDKLLMYMKSHYLRINGGVSY